MSTDQATPEGTTPMSDTEHDIDTTHETDEATVPELTPVFSDIDQLRDYRFMRELRTIEEF